MAKRNAPASQASEEGAIGTRHPLMRALSQTDQFAQDAQKRREAKEFQVAELETWKQTVNILAATSAGRLFLKSLVQHSGMFAPANYKDTLKMVDVRIKSSFYLEWVRPFLEPDLRKEIE